jgi:uncharacterized protein with GYD domain
MCLYSHQISFTSSAWHSLMEDPVDPLGGIRRPVQSLGGNLVSAFFTEDSYDVLAIAEFPETVSVNEITIAFYAGGTVATLHSSPLLSVTQADEAKRKARQRLCHHLPHAKMLAAAS